MEVLTNSYLICPHSNLRAEATVKSMKRLKAKNAEAYGSLHTDDLAMAMLQYCSMLPLKFSMPES